MVDNREVHIYVLKHPDTLEVIEEEKLQKIQEENYQNLTKVFLRVKNPKGKEANLLNFGGLRENLLKI